MGLMGISYFDLPAHIQILLDRNVKAVKEIRHAYHEEEGGKSALVVVLRDFVPADDTPP